MNKQQATKDSRTGTRQWVILFTVATLVASLLVACAAAAGTQPVQTASVPSEVYDVIIRRGRVIDPESGLNAIRNVGIRDGVISTISTEPLSGRIEIDATGLVVAPGFIDVVFQVPEEYRPVQLLDGVTTALDLWIGTDDVDAWYAGHAEKAVTNFGVAVGHERIRRALMNDPGPPGTPGEAMSREATDTEIAAIRSRVERGLDRGALAVSLTNVTPAASGWEALEMFRAARDRGAVMWAPPRETGNWEADDMPRYLTELLGFAAVTGAELCVVHVQASGGPHTPRLLRIVEEARAQGLRVTGEVFPYTANISNIKLWESEDWQNWPDNWFHDLEWMATGERLTRETYPRYQRQGGFVVVHNEDIEPLVGQAVVNPLTMITSGAYLDENGGGHPRASGTHARVLGRYVRQEAMLSLSEALRKMALMPAQLLESRVSAMKNKGRIREGADADIVIFDADSIIDRATFREPTRPSEGVRFVLINGIPVVQMGTIQPGVFAGKPIRAAFASKQER